MSGKRGTVAVGGIEVGRVWLAPMAGYTDIAFRELCKCYGAALTVTEMVSVRGLKYKSAATDMLMRLSPCEVPSCIQFFGNDPMDFAAAARAARCDIIDINMGCPMPKIVKNGDGAALLNNPELAGEIVRAVKDATDKPVTVKTRIGYRIGDEGGARLIESVARAGAAAVTVHGRYAEQRYEGKSDRAAIEKLKSVVDIPVIASGDICRSDLDDALETFDAVMIGRAALSDVGVFSGETPPIKEVATKYIALLQKYFDSRYVINQARKLFVHMFKGERDSKKIRAAVNACRSVDEIYSAIETFNYSVGY